MKIVIAYASAGSGHRRAAEALYDYLSKNCKNAQIIVIDALVRTNPLFKNAYSYGYLFFVHYCIWLWGFSFWLTSLRCLKPINDFLTFILHSINSKDFSRLLINENPDFFISTHFLPSQVSSRLKKLGKIDSNIISVITDFGVHPYWVSEKIDSYVVAADYTKEKLISSGVSAKNIHVLGIPIESKFLEKYDRSALAAKIGVRPDKFTVLITTGSFGIGPVEEIVKLLYKDAQVLVGCANNKRLYARLKKMNYPGVKIFGYVDYVADLMAISDCIIAKPGGLTISEALAMELALIFISPIPGQEIENMNALERYGIMHRAANVSDIKKIIDEYIVYPEKLSAVRHKIRAMKKTDSKKELCDVICRSSIRSPCRAV